MYILCFQSTTTNLVNLAKLVVAFNPSPKPFPLQRCLGTRQVDFRSIARPPHIIHIDPPDFKCSYIKAARVSFGVVSVGSVGVLERDNEFSVSLQKARDIFGFRTQWNTIQFECIATSV